MVGRIAFRLVRDAKIAGFIEADDGRKLLREWRRGHLSIDLRAAASAPPRDEQLSELHVRYAGRKVMDIQWSAVGAFKVIAFERGEWDMGDAGLGLAPLTSLANRALHQR
ncbi:hypothetical protein GGD66_006981 [Bradyrhizobium sp. CIR48]|uniref:hypothetical protein n=1 Tax=Bradyrhizobium sp. CIR48 TaxID=2663840 RepID=UPI0016058A80|nr:hypothetical protein [Bradyrhizobium sp. CIR48]